MREIKFRAWKKHTKQILTDLREFYVDDLNMKGFVFMQYTGLKDKNGKEIYEGDIGKSVDDVLWEVKYDVELARFIGLYDGNIIEDLSEVHDSMEIIGNIYENPELLK